MQTFDRFAKKLREFQKTLVSLVCTSFAASALKVFLEHDQFDRAFHELTLLLSTLVGIAGVLLPFLRTLPKVIESNPLLEKEFFGRGRTLIGLVFAGGCFYVYRYYAVQSAPISALYWYAGVGLLMWVLSSCLLWMQAVELRNTHLKNATQAQRESLGFRG
jgi:hypothetical protein